MFKSKSQRNISSNLVEVKSKFDAEFRRFSIDRSSSLRFDEFERLIADLHKLRDSPFLITYTESGSGDLLPINNDENLAKALVSARPMLRLSVYRKGESKLELSGFGGAVRRHAGQAGGLQISMPSNFRCVSSIIDVGIVPEHLMRVRLMKHGSDKPLGFYIRDGTSIRVTPEGLQKLPAIFISRLVPGGLAESCGLLAVNDEVIEVNGIDVCGKSLDQVTDMMIANAHNLILTMKPFNQRACIKRSSSSRPLSQSLGELNAIGAPPHHQSSLSLQGAQLAAAMRPSPAPANGATSTHVRGASLNLGRPAPAQPPPTASIPAPAPAPAPRSSRGAERDRVRDYTREPPAAARDDTHL